ncbi:hypothetical protein B4N84_06885 [Flavobacterium sp. IR1]|nr:hypothetical protein B4N84_06885 [Flavobacterium sp. IR1]
MMLQDKNLLDNLVLTEEADSLLDAGFINKEQRAIIKKELRSFKIQRNILVRVAFFLLGALLYLSICGFITLIGYSGGDGFFKICLYLFAGVGILGAEYLTNQKYYRHGLDDAFILGILLNLGFGVIFSTESYDIMLIPAVVIAIASLITYYRYLHLLSMLVFCMACVAVLFFGMLELQYGEQVLPFIAMLVAAGFYFFTKKRIASLTEKYFYNGLVLANSFCLVLFYLSCNYLVVRELSIDLLGYEMGDKEIPLWYFFYFMTFTVPPFYLYQALKTKDRIMLWISFLAIAFSIYTVRFYHSVLPIEVALTLGGLLLFAIAWFSIQKLKNKETGLTFKPDRINNSNAILNAETLIVASSFGLKPEVKTDSPMDFGGGGFSGGGSEGSF